MRWPSTWQPAARWTFWWLLLLFVFPTLFETPLLMSSQGDASYFFGHEEAARRTMADYGQLPAWDPWHLGGMVGIGNPQDTSLSPDFLLRLGFGTQKGRRLATILFLLLGMEGMFFLSRQWGAKAVGAMLSGAMFGLCSRHFDHIGNGWINHLGLELLPWVLYCMHRGEADARFRVLGGFFFFWIIMNGGTYPAPVTVVVVGVVSITLALLRLSKERLPSRPSSMSVVWSALSLGMLGCGLSAIRLLPVMGVTVSLPRKAPQPTLTGLDTLAASMLEGVPVDAWATNIVGVWGVALTGLGLLIAHRNYRRSVLLTFLGVVFFLAMAVGEQHPLAPFSLLRQFPIFSQLRRSNLYALVAVMFLAHGAALCLSSLQLHITRWCVRWPNVRRTWPAMCACALGLMWGHSTLPLLQARAKAAYTTQGPTILSQPFRQSIGSRWGHFAAYNLGSLQWFEETPFFQAEGLRAGLPHEEYGTPSESVQVRRVQWTPNRVRLSVNAKRKGTVLLNQNFNDSWQVNDGYVVKATDGLVSVDVPAGRHRLELQYRSSLVTYGAIISLLTWLCCLLYGLFYGRRRTTARS